VPVYRRRLCVTLTGSGAYELKKRKKEHAVTN
jgi:hypothetical protein